MKLLEHTSPSIGEAVGSSIETIAPHLAKRMLGHNMVNRRLDENVVRRYARDMRNGDWVLTGDPIVFDGEGNLIQGQHRLRACVSANTEFSTVVVRGVLGKAQLVMDSGKKRSFGDQLKLLGEKNSGELATAINRCWRYDNCSPQRTDEMPSRTEAIAWLNENPGIRESLLLGKKVENALPVRRTVAASVHYLTARVDQGDADEFFARLISGAELMEGDPILACRRWFDRWAGKRDRPSTIIHMHALMKCVNYWRAGESLKFVKVLPGTEFPRVWGEK